MLRFCFALVLTSLASVALADLSGPLRVIDGDTVAIGETRIRLHGIDAPENGQFCGNRTAPMWPCGSWISGEVRARFDGRSARCVAMDIDKYGRTVARCAVAGEDLGAALVRGGLAFAYTRYSSDYLPQQAEAARRGVGLHGAGVESPADFRKAARRGHDAQHLASAPEGCEIKGNISNRGDAHIYHMPGQAWYGATRINLVKGERWFCSEAEAQDAGWRRAHH
ncbi:thermonuclease family protein [Antarctobacter sp.]|uniref:thermonuclease family protein n=1 Tax=Antarctobacter sp. TaxID=1872577 RepID=UPI002B26D312|nr:thermonuclease family protein [Antarctobacter sp.]